MTNLVDDLWKYYSVRGRPLEEPQVGDLCCALSAVYKEYYRAVIINTVNEDKCTIIVQYIDYGNEESISLDRVFILVEQFCFPHTYAVCLPITLVPANFHKYFPDLGLDGHNYDGVICNINGELSLDLDMNAIYLSDVLRAEAKKAAVASNDSATKEAGALCYRQPLVSSDGNERLFNATRMWFCLSPMSS